MKTQETQFSTQAIPLPLILALIVATILFVLGPTMSPLRERRWSSLTFQRVAMVWTSCLGQDRMERCPGTPMNVRNPVRAIAM